MGYTGNISGFFQRSYSIYSRMAVYLYVYIHIHIHIDIYTYIYVYVHLHADDFEDPVDRAFLGCRVYAKARRFWRLQKPEGEALNIDGPWRSVPVVWHTNPALLTNGQKKVSQASAKAQERLTSPTTL